MLRALIRVCVAVASGCDGDEVVGSPPALVQASVSNGALKCEAWNAPRVAAPGAFDLVVGSEGPLLFWSPQSSPSQRFILSQRLDREGVISDATQRLDLSSVDSGAIEELAVAAAAGTIGVAWVVRHGNEATALEAHGAERSVPLLTPQSLGKVEASDAARGRVLMAAGEDGELQVTWRGERSPCEAQVGTCSHYNRRSLKRGGPGDSGVITREMLAPCDPLLIGSLWADGSWYEGVCHESPNPVAFVFSFRPAISYAEANEVFGGCSSFALARSRFGAALWAECSDGMALATRSHVPELGRTIRRVTRSMRCVAGRPVLVAAGQGGVEEFPLSSPSDGLGPALPPLPFGARAVWTGSHVIAAYVEGGRLRLTRGACRDAGFEWCRDGKHP